MLPTGADGTRSHCLYDNAGMGDGGVAHVDGDVRKPLPVVLKNALGKYMAGSNEAQEPTVQTAPCGWMDDAVAQPCSSSEPELSWGS